MRCTDPRGSRLCFDVRQRLSHTRSFMADAMFRQLSRFRAFVSFFLVAAAQFLSPAAAADPASKIDPPAWSHRHSKQEVQAYGARATAWEAEKKRVPVIRETRLRRILREQRREN